jgi:hypothetical protein
MYWPNAQSSAIGTMPRFALAIFAFLGKEKGIASNASKWAKYQWLS